MTDLIPDPAALAVPLALGAAAGVALGLALFGGLWLTVRGLSAARRPGLALALSSLVRLGLVALALAALARFHPAALGGAVAAMLATRMAMTRRLAPARRRAARTGD